MPAFDTPLLQFRLSDDKVRELLMRRQLYGEPDLAIREHYQNALDACRYRRTRRIYLDQTDVPTTSWTGRIEILPPRVRPVAGTRAAAADAPEQPARPGRPLARQ
jgi:hypothetical protein